MCNRYGHNHPFEKLRDEFSQVRPLRWAEGVELPADLAAELARASGVVIAGGLGLRIRDSLLASGFAQRFRAKGRFESLMAALPVKLITHPQPGLFGAAAAFAQAHSR